MIRRSPTTYAHREPKRKMNKVEELLKTLSSFEPYKPVTNKNAKRLQTEQWQQILLVVGILLIIGSGELILIGNTNSLFPKSPTIVQEPALPPFLRWTALIFGCLGYLLFLLSAALDVVVEVVIAHRWKDESLRQLLNEARHDNEHLKKLSAETEEQLAFAQAILKAKIARTQRFIDASTGGKAAVFAGLSLTLALLNALKNPLGSISTIIIGIALAVVVLWIISAFFRRAQYWHTYQIELIELTLAQRKADKSIATDATASVTEVSRPLP